MKIEILIDKTIHRNNQFRYSLCGLKVKPECLTTDDNKVTCWVCKEKLRLITYTDTKTEMIKIIKVKTT